MLKKVMATAAATLSVAAAGAMMAPQAMAIGNDTVTSDSGSNSTQVYGNSETWGDYSPQIGLIQGSLNKPCIGLPAKADVGSVAGVVPITVQDILTTQQNQQCTENSTQVKGDDPLSHILDNIPVLSGNAATGS
ncbi:rodlin [Streptomyces sp. NPDC005408]|uniref:rodlin n=1 Tax=Streptomyces sp. NPDC005408 TaxID=3155341 RepID=UPI0033B654DB